MFNIIQNIILGISLAAPIGPASIAVIKRGLKYGFLSGFLVGVGVTAADATYLLIVYFGLSNFINIPIVKTLIWTLGAIVLMYLGCQSIKEYFEKIDLDEFKTQTGKNSFVVGYIINISNPMAIIWWVGVFGSILGSLAQNIPRMTALLNSLTILIGILLWHSTVSLLLHLGRKRFINENTMRYVSAIAGFVLIGFGLYFGYNAFISQVSL